MFIPSIRIDDDKFQQIMTNLIDNACKYSESGKKVVVSTNFADSDNVLIKVIDEGIGIKKEDSEKIFNKFIRLDNHLTSKTQGNGLGLYITKNLVDQMNGEIGITSKAIGTEVWLRFPFYNQEEVLRCSQQS